MGGARPWAWEQDLGRETKGLPRLHLLLCFPDWRVSKWKKKVRRLSNLESRIQKSKTSLVPSPRNLEIMMANIDHRGQHLYQAFWFSRLFPLCSFTHSGNIKTGLIEFRNEE